MSRGLLGSARETRASAADDGDKPLDHKGLCESLHSSYNDLMLIATANSDEGNRAASIKAYLDAKSVRDAAYAERCGWAWSGRRSPGSTARCRPPGPPRRD